MSFRRFVLVDSPRHNATFCYRTRSGPELKFERSWNGTLTKHTQPVEHCTRDWETGKRRESTRYRDLRRIRTSGLEVLAVEGRTRERATLVRSRGSVRTVFYPPPFENTSNHHMYKRSRHFYLATRATTIAAAADYLSHSISTEYLMARYFISTECSGGARPPRYIFMHIGRFPPREIYKTELREVE